MNELLLLEYSRLSGTIDNIDWDRPQKDSGELFRPNSGLKSLKKANFKS